MGAIAAQSFACVAASLGGFVAGTILGWSTAMIPLLQAADPSTRMTNDQIGWVMSALGVGSAIGPIATWLVVDRIGRRTTLLVSVVPMIVSYVIVACRAEYLFLLLGRLLSGLGVGVYISSAPLYIGEVAENRVRGAMGVLGVTCMNCGSLFVYALGPFVNVAELNAACACVAAGLSSLLFFIPESPYYHLIHDNSTKAEASLTWLRRSDNVKTELTEISVYLEKKKLESSEAFDFITRRGNRRAMTILLIIQTMQLFSGSIAIPAYAYNIFADSGYSISANTLVVTMGTVALLASFAGLFLVDRIGRVPVLYFCASTMAACLLALGTFYTLQSHHQDVSEFSWVPFVAIMGFTISHACGIHSLPAILLSEYFPTNVKAKASMIFTIVMSIGGSVSFKLFQMSYDDLGLGTTFFLCCSFLLCGTIIVAFIMPETKGFSLQKIENMLSGEKTEETVVETAKRAC